MNYRSGVVALVGKPNVGKSTLVNTLVGQKVSIVSNKAQTTRKRALGILTTPDWQIVLVDTPGVHSPVHRLGKALVETAKQSVADVDVLVVVVDASQPPNRDDEKLALQLRDEWFSENPKRKHTVLCLNKMDLLRAQNVQENYEKYVKLFPVEETLMTSMTKRQNIDILLGVIVRHLPEGPPHYDDESYTDQSVRTMAAELVREKALAKTRQEVPHAIATYVESWEETPKITNVSMVILVEKEGQKAILIGKKGAMLREIGTESRAEIEKLIGKKVFLEMYVKVREDWRQNPRILQELDYL